MRTILAAILLMGTAAAEWTRDEVIANTMTPYGGPSVAGVDTSTLTGKVLCGYQGWFACEGDGSNRGWFHWEWTDGFKPGSCKIDLWPDVSELDEDEKYATEFRHADGSTAYVYSAYNKKTVLRHFEWMRAYGIDGVFVQRFAVETVPPVNLNFFTTVLGHCREGANRSGRTYAVMYDLSGLREGETEHVIEDWKLLVNRMRIGRDSNDRAYLRHQGKPVVAVWGIGFNDDRKYTLDECAKLIDFLKNDPDFGGCTVMIGVPTYWRTLDRDCVADAKLHEVMLGADIVSPWAVGRYRDLDGVALHAEEQLGPDLEWCREHGKEYLPVVFPGFSWHNMFPDSPLNLIPRLGGQFLTKQYEAAIGAGATMVYQAMFDEVDEGTAIYKCTNDPPAGESQFVTYEGLPSDHYLKLVGQQTQCLREKLESGDAPGCYAKP